MRHPTLCWIALCLWVAPGFGQNSPTVAPTPAQKPVASTSQADVDAIQHLEDDWRKAEETTDIDLLQRILADDFVNLIPSGVGPGKAELIQNLQPHAGQAPPYTLATRDMRIYILGDTAIAAYVKTYVAKESGNVAHEDTTHIYVKDRGAWKLRMSRASVCPESGGRH